MARLSFLLPLACAIGLGRERAFMETYPYGIKSERIRSWITGRMLAGDSAAGGLPGNPWPSLAQFHLLARSVRKRLDEVRAPCLAVHSADDDIAGASNVELLRRRLGGPVETVWLRDSYHMITVDQERDAVIDASARFFSRLAPASLRAPAA
jgi:carboxylesterase